MGLPAGSSGAIRQVAESSRIAGEGIASRQFEDPTQQEEFQSRRKCVGTGSREVGSQQSGSRAAIKSYSILGN